MMSRLRYFIGCLGYESCRCINSMMLHPLISRVEKHNIRREEGLEKIKCMRRLEDTIKEIR